MESSSNNLLCNYRVLTLETRHEVYPIYDVKVKRNVTVPDIWQSTGIIANDTNLHCAGDE